MEHTFSPSPIRSEYVRQQQLEQARSIGIVRKYYATTAKPDAFPADEAGIFTDLAAEDGSLLLQESDGATLRLESSSSSAISLIYLFSTLMPVTLGGVATGFSSGVETNDLSLVFPTGFFKVGDIMVFEVTGKITENAINSSIGFSLYFPDTGAVATIAMPTTVDANSLSDFVLRITSIFSYDASGNGVVSHSGELTVKNTTVASGESTSLLTTIQNTFDYESVLYYKPQMAWNTQSANSVVEFYTGSVTVL